MNILARTAIDAKRLEKTGALFIIGGDHAAVAVPAQILAGEKTEAAYVTDAAGTPVVVLRAYGLCRILDHPDPAPGGHFHQRVHVRTRPEKMYRNHGAYTGIRLQRVFHPIHVYVEGLGLNIHKHRLGTEPGDGSGRR